MLTLPATTVDFFLAGLESFMTRSGQGTHWAVTMLQLGGKPDAAVLTRAWEQIHAHHPMLGARLKRLWRGWRLVWVTSGPATPPAIVWHASDGRLSIEAIIHKRLQGKCSAGDITPPLFMEVFPSEEGTDHTILLTWRHALMDGTGVNLLLEKLVARACDARPPELAAPKRESWGRVFQRARPLMQRLHALTYVGCRSAWDKKMAKAGLPRFTLIELSAEQSQTAFSRLRTLCGEFLQMPFYAAVAARAMRLLHERRGWRSPAIHLQLPTQMRGRSRNLIFGNHMGTLPLFLDAAVLGSMDEAVNHLLEKYREAMKQEMPQASEALMTLASHLPPTWFVPLVRLQNQGEICSLFHSHTGTFLPGRAELAGAAIQNVCTVPSVCSPPGLGVFCSDYAGRITVTLSWRDSGVSAAEIDAVSQQMLADLTGQPSE